MEISWGSNKSLWYCLSTK